MLLITINLMAFLFLFLTDNTIKVKMRSNLCDHYPEGPKALGMESGEIKDEAISASSSYHKQNVGPQNAR